MRMVAEESYVVIVDAAIVDRVRHLRQPLPPQMDLLDGDLDASDLSD